jgi:aminocarboxymuconate-semialdehyde decarboxylase
VSTVPNGPASVDVHGHALSPRLVELTAGRAGPPNAHNDHLMRTRYQAPFADVAVRLETMDRAGIDLQVVSHMPNFGYWADEDLSRRIVDAANTAVLELCQAHPTRFVGLAFVSLQSPELAARQLEEAMGSLGMRGAEIGTFVDGMELGDPRLDPFWATAERLGALVFLHPVGSTLGGRLAPYYFSNVIGNPLDTTIALGHIIFGGVLERFPRLKLVAAHGGGYLPAYFPRFEHGFEVRPEAQQIPYPPSHYLRQLWVDTLVYQPETLGAIIRRMGSDRVVLGTDYPFDMGEEQPLDVLAAVTDLTVDDRARITHRNALALLELDR